MRGRSGAARTTRTAFEAALKVKELTGIAAEPYSPPDLMHGPIAVLGPDHGLLAFAPPGATAAGVTRGRRRGRPPRSARDRRLRRPRRGPDARPDAGVAEPARRRDPRPAARRRGGRAARHRGRPPVRSLEGHKNDLISAAARVHWKGLQIAERIKSDVASAMKAGERDRVTALRLVLSELQKADKEGDADELAVLRRERKRRREAAEAYREAAREDLAEGEDFEAQLIEHYLPADVSDEELDELVRRAVAETGAESQRDMGKVIKHVMAAADGRADGRRVSTKVKEALS